MHAQPNDRLELVQMNIVPFEGGFQLRASQKSLSIRGLAATDMFPALLPLLDGTRDLTQITEALAERFEADAVQGMVTGLRKAGLVRSAQTPPADLFPDGDVGPYETLVRYLDEEDRFAGLSAIRRSRVLVIGPGAMSSAVVASLVQMGVGQIDLVGAGQVDDSVIQRSRGARRSDVGRPLCEWLTERLPLSDRGVTLTDTGPRPDTQEGWSERIRGYDLAVVLVDAPILFYPWLETFNAASIEAELPWISAAVIDSTTVHVGPTVVPGETACYACFEARFKSNLTFASAHAIFERFAQETERLVDLGHLPPVDEFAASLVATEVLRCLVPGRAPRSSGRLMTFDLEDFRSEKHDVLRLPRCSACGGVHLPPMQLWS